MSITARALTGEEDVMSIAQVTAASPTALPSRGSLRDKIAIRDLDFYYGEYQGAQGVTLPLYENRATAFIGPSGCGKSTLLRVLNRMYDLYPGQRAEGQVLLDGDDILEAASISICCVRGSAWCSRSRRRFR